MAQEGGGLFKSKVPLSPDGPLVGDCDLIFADEEGDTAGEPRTSCDPISK